MTIPIALRLHRENFVPPATKKKKKGRTEYVPSCATPEVKEKLQRMANKMDISLRELTARIFEEYVNEKDGNGDGVIAEGQCAEKL